MHTIYKYIIDPYQPEIEMPVGAEVLSVAFQRDNFCLWAKVDPKAQTEKRTFKALGTGHDIPSEMGINYTFIGTGHMDNGLVFHAFEVSL